MARRSRRQTNDLMFPIVVLIGATAELHRTQLVHLAYISLGAISILLLLKLAWGCFHLRPPLHFQNVEAMNGLDFERYVASLLQTGGFRNVTLTERYDLGVDIIAEKDGIRWGIQVKRHAAPIKAAAVRQVVTGLKVYSCDQTMVITNSTYTAVARRLAQANGCLLIDGTGLKRLVKQRSIL